MFSSEAGDENFLRNAGSRRLPDALSHPVIRTLDFLQKFPDSYLEVGCSSGYLVEHMRRRGCGRSLGLDLSPKAISQASTDFPGSHFFAGTLSDFCSNGSTNLFEVVHLGFYLFVMDPGEWIAEIMRALSLVEEGGILVIHDFYLPAGARSLPYSHDPNVTSSKGPFFGQLDMAIPGILQEFRLVRAAQAITAGGKQPEGLDFEAVFIYRKMRMSNQFVAT